jgi:hypothetical protein
MKKIVILIAGLLSVEGLKAQMPINAYDAMAMVQKMNTDVNQFVVNVKTLKIGSTTVDQATKLLGKPIMVNKNDGITTTVYNLVDKSINQSKIPQMPSYKQVGNAHLIFNKDNTLKNVQVIKTSFEGGTMSTETIYKKGSL